VSRVVIVGASVAGVRTAQALRREGWAGPIVLIGDEDAIPYDKPPLSKAALAGTTPLDQLCLLPEPRAAGLDLDLRLGSAAVGLDVVEQLVHLADGTSLGYTDAVVATGARARPSPWGTPRGLHLLRTADDCRRLGADLAGASSIVVIGGGFIGSEVAATARGRGLQVTIVDPVPLPMARIVGDEVAAILAGVHEPHGVTTRFGVGVHDVRETEDGLVVALTDGGELHADVAVVGIGAAPNIEWLAGSGLAVEDGVTCDEFCRTVGGPHVFAAGDVARWWHPREGGHRRVEHWTNAVEQAATVGHNLVHPDDLRPYNPVDYVWSDQYDWRIQMAGRCTTAVAPELLGDPADARFAALYRDETGRFTGAVTANWQKAMVAVRRLLLAGEASIDAARAAVEAAHQKRGPS